MIERILEKQILAKINTNKAIILLGSRQVGKTTLLKSLFENSSETIWLNADEPDIQAIFANISSNY
jgi:predicted AAA+ superfamily ATPase